MPTEAFFNQGTAIGRLRRSLYDLIQEHDQSGALPTSSRFLFYELVQRAVISKQARSPRLAGQCPRRPDQDMTDALFDLRDKGYVAWSAIVDETRALEAPFVADTVLDWVLAVLGSDQPMLDPWSPGRRPMILTESRSLAGVLRAMLREYSVTFAATNGQVGGFLRTDVAPRLEAGDRVLYLGDLDLAGVRHIEANTRRVLERLRGGLRWERLALTLDQVREHNVPAMLKTDHRFKDDRGVHEAYETEALSQTVIVDIVRARLDDLLPEPLADVQERQEQESAELQELLEA